MAELIEFPGFSEQNNWKKFAAALRPVLFKSGLSPSEVDWTVKDLGPRFARIDAALAVKSTPHQIAVVLLDELVTAIGEIYQLEVLGERRARD